MSVALYQTNLAEQYQSWSATFHTSTATETINIQLPWLQQCGDRQNFIANASVASSLIGGIEIIAFVGWLRPPQYEPASIQTMYAIAYAGVLILVLVVVYVYADRRVKTDSEGQGN